MDKWITLHRKGQVTWVNFEQRLEMYFADGVTVIKALTPFGDYFDESPAEILAMLSDQFDTYQYHGLLREKYEDLCNNIHVLLAALEDFDCDNNSDTWEKIRIGYKKCTELVDCEGNELGEYITKPSELRQAARELIAALRAEEKENDLPGADYFTIPVIDARTKLEALLEDK